MLLARLVEDLGQLSALEAGALELEPASVPVGEALERAAAAIRATCSATVPTMSPGRETHCTAAMRSGCRVGAI